MNVLVTEHLSSEALSWLEERHSVWRGMPDASEVADHLMKMDAMVIRTYTEVDDALLDRCPNLRVIGRAGVGLDQVDVDACTRRGVQVVHTPSANTQAVVEYVLALVLDAIRPRERLTAAIDGSEWSAVRKASVGVRQLGDLTVGILGMGRIGRRVARVMSSFGASVLYNDLVEVPEGERWGARPVELDELLSASDVLSVHIDGRASNDGFLDSERLGRLRSDVVFVNTSRGCVVDNSALAKAMRERPGGVALIDVFDPEPIPEDASVWGVGNIRLYPHLAARTEAAMLNMSWVVRDVDAVLRGEAAAYPANRLG